MRSRRSRRGGNVIPLYREILADFETPVSAFKKIDHGPSAYLLESVEGGQKWARYSFLGSGYPVLLHADADAVAIAKGSRVERFPLSDRPGDTPLDRLRKVMSEYRPVAVPELPPFVGGAVGYLSYDMVRYFEDIPAKRKDDVGFPLTAFLLTDTLLIFDNVAHTIKVVANAHVASSKAAAVQRAYKDAASRIDGMIERLRRPLRRERAAARRKPISFSSNMSRADFEKMVMRTKEYIRAGDIVQTVVSQRWETRIQTSPLRDLSGAPPRQSLSLYVLSQDRGCRAGRVVPRNPGSLRRGACLLASDCRYKKTRCIGARGPGVGAGTASRRQRASRTHHAR